MDADLSRALTSHERWRVAGSGYHAPDGEMERSHWTGAMRQVTRYRHPDTGFLWRWLDGAWVLDLEDAGTAGVLVGMLPPEWEVSREDGWWRVFLYRAHLGVITHSFGEPTLGEAAARALLAAWEAA